MRSQKPAELQRQVSALQASGMLRYTQAQNRNAAEALEPVPYFVIPAQSARKVGTMVVPFVNLDRRGILSLTAPKAYGVVDRPTKAVVQNASVRLMESHVIAEDAALRRGLYTPFGRSASEMYVARMVAEGGNAESYIPDRVAHLGALAVQIKKEQIFPRTQEIVDELERGQDTLMNYASDLGIDLP